MDSTQCAKWDEVFERAKRNLEEYQRSARDTTRFLWIVLNGDAYDKATCRVITRLRS